MSETDFTRPTTDFWQRIDTSESHGFNSKPPYRFGYPAVLPDARVLVLPIRRIAGQERAVASLIANQAALPVVNELAAMMAALTRGTTFDRVVGLPTLGLAFAPQVAERVGHTRFVPLGYSKKLWYDEALSVPVNSLTTPDQVKRLYLDPNQRSLLDGQRAIIIDDAVSTGGTLKAALHLLGMVNCTVAAVVVAMRQGTRWREIAAQANNLPVLGVFDSPRLVLKADGWWPEETM
jgi:adenine/guanine phosphoribosyltransferase-like PRPP-binding protein